MSDEKAILAAIWEHPHEDTPRLMYADWLQENGQPERAEFIQVQCELARLGEWDESPRKGELEKREQQLWKKHAKEWKAGLSSYLQKLGGFVRGFPAPQPRAMPSSKFLKLTADDFAGAPLWEFHFPTNYKLLPALLASPLLLRIGTLDFRFWLKTAESVRQFVSSPNVRNIADLNLDGCRLGASGVSELVAGAAALPNLRRLDLQFNDLTADAMDALAASPLVDGLRDLQLFYNALGSAGLLALAHSPRLVHLERLNLTSCDEDEQVISHEAVAGLCSSSHLAALKDLTLDPHGFGPRGTDVLCATRPVFLLRWLRLTPHHGLGDGGAEALAAWPALAEVRVLHLYATDIGAAGAKALARSPHLNRITELRVDLNPLRNDRGAVKALRDRFGYAVRID